ncbi:MAG: Bsp6I family type II restriction endonuclease [bacterium]|nr:Bsp6I family type II restriction endonuclease [bacterium]
MKLNKCIIKTKEGEIEVEVARFSKVDAKTFKKLFDIWVKLNDGLGKYGRKVNIPEVLSEGMFCVFSNSVRFQRKLKGKGSVSFDTINLETGEREQIKASSIEADLTSFGPKSEWDKLYFMSFYKKEKLDGTFDVYEIPNKLIYKNKVNHGQTMELQQKEKRRPRFSIINDIIKPYRIKPIGKNIKIW